MKVTNPVEYFNGFDVAAIGPTTKMELEKNNLKVTITPEEYTIEGLANAIVDYYK
jgi:uroporphyrinogen-III synthase